MTKIETGPDVYDVVESWVAARKPRKLPRRELTWLLQWHDSLTAGPLASPAVADGFCCEELELQPGSTEAEVIASLLDYVQPLEPGGSRLREVRELLPV